MGAKKSRRRVSRKTTIELLEDRQMFSADPLGGAIEHHDIWDDPLLEHHGFTEAPPLEMHSEPLLEHHGFEELPPLEQHEEPSLVHHVEQPPDFWYDADFQPDLGGLLGDIEQTLASAHNLTGVTQARANYGFLGTGQTVAIIDSGIAWNHPALGGGFGANYRVVGGWDFTEENDANPYDDGPAGSHGTHVAGIVGANAGNSSDSGVAPGVDLIGLRVFNDQGAGYFSWVENALQWLYTNRNSFANPVTAVNLSLGTSWNSATIPAWATLEDEFALLESAGIFIAVSAGNAFLSYQEPGLSYPAASPYVVPVMSVDDNGSLSYYSQRHERAIAAPGRTIRSTVPDYAGNNNGVADDWGNKSGTSMAAPYVAGASVIIREAMQFVGYTNITQDMIFDHMVATSDQFFDSATNAYYNRLNVAAAIDALMPEDDYGSTTDTAYDLGTLAGSGTENITGTLARLDDVDYFQFTASTAGTVSLDLNGNATWVTSSLGSFNLNGDVLSINVAAGQTYIVGLQTNGQVAHFQFDVSYNLASAVDPSAIGRAYQLDQELGLYFVGGYSQNWGGLNEKWMKAADNSWYFITPDGTLYHWAGGTKAQIGASQAIATLSQTHYARPNLVHDAPDVNQPLGDLAYDLDFEIGWRAPSSYALNWGGMNEKWFQAATNKWFFVTPNGSLYEWNAQSTLATSRLMWQFDASVYTTPSLLHDATAVQISLPQLAYQLDQQLGLYFPGGYSTNWGGWGEKWMKGNNSTWYFITPNGNFYRWNGQANLSTSALIATLDSTYHANPALLHDAANVSGTQLAVAQTSQAQAAWTSPQTHFKVWMSSAPKRFEDVTRGGHGTSAGDQGTRLAAAVTAQRDLVFASFASRDTIGTDDNGLQMISEGQLADESYTDSVDELFSTLGLLTEKPGSVGRQ